MVLAVDRTMVGSGLVSFYSGSLFRGTVTLGNNPTVVTMPLLQVTTWDNAGTWQPGPARFRFGTISDGPTAFIQIIPPDPSSTSP